AGDPGVRTIRGDREGDVRRLRDPRLEEVPDVVRVREPRRGDPLTGFRIDRAVELRDQTPVERRTPALVDLVEDTAPFPVDVGEPAVVALPVLVLEVGEPQRRLKRDLLAERPLAALSGATARLRRDEDRAVRRPRTVERRGRGALEDRDRLDVLGRDVLDGVTVVEPAVPLQPRARVVDRDAVHDDERLVVPRDRLGATDHDARGTALRTGVRDVDARHAAGEGVHQVRLEARELVPRDRLGRNAHRPGLPLDPQGRDDDAFEADDLDLHRHVDRADPRNLLLDRTVSDEREDEDVSPGRDRDLVAPGTVRHRADGRPLDHDLHAGYRLPGRRVGDPPGHLAGLLGRSRSRDE